MNHLNHLVLHPTERKEGAWPGPRFDRALERALASSQSYRITAVRKAAAFVLSVAGRNPKEVRH